MEISISFTTRVCVCERAREREGSEREGRKHNAMLI
jgi:hypothetical protein